MNELLLKLFPNVIELHSSLLESIWQTFVMVSISGVLGLLLGTAAGILLVVTASGGIYEHKLIHSIFGKVINIFRSIPFVILIAFLVSFTRFLVGTSIGIPGAIVPMVIGIIPFVSRLIEQALLEVDPGVIEAARSMGISRKYIITHILIPEALPGILRTLVTSIISLIGLSAMAGTVGGGGLGNFAIRYGYSRYMNDVTIVTVVILLLIVNLIQSGGNRIAKKITH